VTADKSTGAADDDFFGLTMWHSQRCYGDSTEFPTLNCA
jgi:hypothetical protein